MHQCLWQIECSHNADSFATIIACCTEKAVKYLQIYKTVHNKMCTFSVFPIFAAHCALLHSTENKQTFLLVYSNISTDSTKCPEK